MCILCLHPIVETRNVLYYMMNPFFFLNQNILCLKIMSKINSKKSFQQFALRLGPSTKISVSRSLPPLIDKTVGFLCDPNLIKYLKSCWLCNCFQHTGRKITFMPLIKQIAIPDESGAHHAVRTLYSCDS